ncbi:hypothetical protein [Sphingomonas asaccharolytica]|uniref:hypothetical protein n=1 Tax=Sphingomonas asaccharolytica TaxID=40681 RepID=UPI0008302C5B|nr:hypothetical protein [Sphingomonas asaccharolytica]
MQYYEFIASRGDTGAVLPLAKVTVFLAGTTTLASIFDNTGAGLTNPMTAAISGLVGFAAANGAYDVQIASADGSYLAPKVHDLQLYDLSQLDAQVAAVTAATTAPGLLAVAADLALGAASKIGTVAADLLSGASNIAVVAADLALGGASLIRQAISSATAAASSAAAAAASAASIGWFFRGPAGFALTDTAGYRWLNISLTDIKHAAIDLIKSRLAALEAYAAKLPLIGTTGFASWALTDSNGYNWFRATPTTLQHKVIDSMSNRIVAALRGPADPSIANMRIIAERIGLHMSGESLSLGHGSPVVTMGTSTTSDMFGNAVLTKASIVPDDINDISSSSDPDLIANRAALTPAIETSYGSDADDWTSHGETPLTGCAQMIVQLLKDEDGIDFLGSGMRFLLADDGRNGGSITTEDETLTGLTAQRVYASFGQAQALYSAIGKSYAPAAQMIVTGTNDNASDSTNYPGGADAKWFYTRAQTVQMQRQAKAIALKLVSPNARLPLLMGQTATHTNPAFNAPIPHIALDQLQLAIDHPEFILACIQYAVQNGVNDVHMTGAGSKQMGAYFGWHLKRLMFDGQRIGPMVPTFTAQNSQIVATFPIRPRHAIAGGLTVADTTVLTNWGVAAVDAGGAAQVLSNPRVVARDRIIWDAPAAPANTWKFRCGYTGNTTKGWTNIAETRADSTLIFDPYALRLPMYRWLPICEVPLT